MLARSWIGILLSAVSVMAGIGLMAPSIVAAERSVITVCLQPNGSVEIEGKIYSVGAPLDSKLEELANRAPRPEMGFATGGEAESAKVALVLRAMQKAEFLPRGFIINPGRCGSSE
ncbi:MAG: hypothetical protein V3S07_09360 [Micropepsaceae bacterium]